MDNETLVKHVKDELESAIGRPGGTFAQERELAWKRFNGDPDIYDTVEGESDVIDSTVADTVDGFIPALLRIFAVPENLINFGATGLEDEPAAAQHSDYVNHVFWKEACDEENVGAFMFLFFWFFDTLLNKVGYAMATWDQSDRIEQEFYKDLTEEERAQVLAEVEDELVGDPESEESKKMFEVDGVQVERTVYTLRFKRKNTHGAPLIENVPPDEMRVSTDCRYVGIGQKVRLVARERDLPRSDLVQMGFDKEQVGELPAAKIAHQTSEKVAKQSPDERNTGDPDKSQERVTLCEAYILVDYDEDGISERRQVFLGSGRLLKWNEKRAEEKGETYAIEIVDRHPFHSMSAYPLPHKHIARGVDDKVGDLQDVNTDLMRGSLTNLAHTNNPGHGIDRRTMGEDTLDDLLNTETGRVVRFNGDPNTGHKEMTVPFTASASFPMMEWIDKLKRDRTGLTGDDDTIDAESLKHIQQSVMAQAFDRNMKVEAVARIIAETGVKSLFRHLSELLMKHQDKEAVVKLRGEWVPVNPREWKDRRNLTTNIGLGAGMRTQKGLHLENLWTKATTVAQAQPNLIFKPKHIYNLFREMVHNADYKHIEQFADDPGEELAPPMPDEMVQLQQQQQQLDAQQQQIDAANVQIKEQKLQLDLRDQSLRHQRELMDMERKTREQEDKLYLANEKLRNELAALAQKEPKVRAEVQQIMQNIEESRSRTAQNYANVVAQTLENDATESGVLEALEEMTNGEEPATSDA